MELPNEVFNVNSVIFNFGFSCGGDGGVGGEEDSLNSINHFHYTEDLWQEVNILTVLLKVGLMGTI